MGRWHCCVTQSVCASGQAALSTLRAQAEELRHFLHQIEGKEPSRSHGVEFAVGHRVRMVASPQGRTALNLPWDIESGWSHAAYCVRADDSVSGWEDVSRQIEADKVGEPMKILAAMHKQLQ